MATVERPTGTANGAGAGTSQIDVTAPPTAASSGASRT